MPAKIDINETCFASSLIRNGKALLLVTAIGDSSKMGRMSAMVKAGESAGHFKRVLDRMVHAMLVIVFVTLIVVWTTGFFRAMGFMRFLQCTVQIIVTGVPLGLPTVVTTTLTVGSSFLAKKQASVKRLSAIEALAGVEVLCTDK